MRLILFSAEQSERQLLEESFTGLFDEIILHAQVSNINTLQAKDCVLAFATQDNLKTLHQYTNTNPVFVIQNEKSISAEHDNFEEIFTAPIRIGRIIESIKQFIKRQQSHEAMASIELGNLTLNPKINLLYNDDVSVRLTEKEMDILLYIYKHEEHSVSKNELLNKVWGYVEDVETHTLETHIYRLRQKLQKNLNLNGFLLTDEKGYYLKF